MIRTLIVMATYGQIFFSKENFFDRQVGETDISLTAGLISAIYNMTTETQQQKITELELEDDRSVFRELPGEKLFIITVDKRMDTDDADDMVDDLAKRFVDQYGDIVMDGMILSDFEPVVDDVVEDRLWYSTVAQKLKFADVLTFLVMLFAAAWYPLILLQGETWIIQPIEDGLASGSTQLLINSISVGLMLLGPIILLVVLLSHFSNLDKTVTFALEFIRRPTRGGYAELLPTWFLTVPLIIIVAFVSIVISGRGIQYALTIQIWSQTLIDTVVVGDGSGRTILWTYVLTYLLFYLITWFLVFPAIVGTMVGEFNWNWMKSSSIIVAYSFILFFPSHIIGGEVFHELIGFNPNDPAIFQAEARSLEFLFSITLPANLFIFVFIFYVGIGLSQLVKINKERYPIALGIGLFLNLALQDFIFFLIFESDIIYPPIL